MDPWIQTQSRGFTTLRTIVLSFHKTAPTHQKEDQGASFIWTAGKRLQLCIPGISSYATAVNVSPHPGSETVVILVATEHASTLMVETLAETNNQNLLLNLDLIKRAIMHRLRPIYDAVQAVENGWTKNGDTGLFTLEDAETMHPLIHSYLPAEWS